MQLLGVALLCGALLGVAADTTINKGGTTFQIKVPENSVPSPNSKIQVSDFSSTLSCGQVDNANTDSVWYFSAGSIIMQDADTGELVYDVSTLEKHWSGGVETSPPLSEAFTRTDTKYTLCACSTQISGQCTAGIGTNFTTPIGFLHVLDTPSAVGSRVQATGTQDFLKPPMVLLPASTPSAASTTKVSFAFTSTESFGVRDKIKVISVPSLKANRFPEREELALAGYQCGQSNNNVLITSDITSVNVPMCTNGNAVDKSPTTTNTSCGSYIMRSSDNFVAPSVNPETQADKAFGYICFCNAASSPSKTCDTDADFGAALGPVAFYHFVVSDQTKHFTARADENQVIEIAAKAGSSQMTDRDMLAFVRQDEPAAGDRGWNYNSIVPANAFGRGPRECGWSNLDFFPDGTSTYEYGKSPNGTNPISLVPAAVVTSNKYVFDFRLAQGRIYSMCYCQAYTNSGTDQFPSSLSTVPGYSRCPTPATEHDYAAASGSLTLTSFNSNFNGFFLNTFYGQSAGTLHIVNTHGAATNWLLQVSSGQHVHINMNSRSSYGDRVADHEYYQSVYSAFVKSQFYVTAGECGDPAVSWLPNIAGGMHEMSVRVKDTGSNAANNPSAVHIAADPSTDSSTTWDVTSPAQAWGSLWSLETGHFSDTFKPIGGVGSAAGDASSSHSSGAGVNGGYLPTASGVTGKLCFCDHVTEFPRSNSIDNQCAVGARSGNYDNFKAEIGEVKVAKFIFNSAAASAKHYTIFQKSTNTLTITVPSASSTTDPTSISTNDKIGILPFYGDGYGIDNASPAVTSSASPFADPTEQADAQVRNRAWKTDYACGRDTFGTDHFFYRMGSWVNVAKTQAIGLATATSSEIVTNNIDASSYTTYKYKMCFCSTAAWGGAACPTSIHSDMADFSGLSTGFVNAYRYADFAGYLHIVNVLPTASLPLYSAIFPGYNQSVAAITTTALNTYPTSAVSGNVLYVQRDTTCGSTGAYGAASGLLNSSTQLLSSTAELLPPSFSSSVVPLDLSACYCSEFSEALEETVGFNRLFTSDTCTSSNFGRFGATIGNLAIKAPVTSRTYSKHFTVTYDIFEEQSFDIHNYNSEAVVTVASDTVAEASADHVGFLQILNSTIPQCGQTQVESQHVVPIVSKSDTALTTKAYNYPSAAFLANSISAVCYCQVDLYDGEACSVTTPSRWISIGYLHVVQPFSGTSNFIAPYSSDPAGSRIYVQFEQQLPSTPKFLVMGTDRLATDSSFTTARCGAAEEYEGAIPAFSSTSAFSANATLLPIAGSATYEVALGASNISGGVTLGVDTFKWLCMCLPSQLSPQTGATTTCPYSSAVGDLELFGITVGKVYFEKRSTMEGTVGSTYYSDLLEHVTLLGPSDVSEEITLTTTPGAFTSDPTTSDVIGFMAKDGICGVDSVLPGLTSAVTPGVGKFSASVITQALQQGTTSQFTFYQITTYKICMCHHAVLGSCSEDVAFFETAGFLHIANAKPTVTTVTANTEVTIPVEFKDTPYELRSDRFAVIPSSAKCGQYDNISTAPLSAFDFVNPFYEVAAAIGRESTSGQAPLVQSGAAISTTPKMNFTGNAGFRLCYCSPVDTSIASVCPSKNASALASSTVAELVDYYSNYGTELAVFRSVTFLTSTDNQAFTITTGTSNVPQLKIIQTDGSISFSPANDKWNVIAWEDECGSAESVLSTGGLTSSGTPDTSTFAQSTCSNATNITTCSSRTTMYTVAVSQDAFSTLAAGKYKLCLCSAVGTSTTGDCDTSDQYTDQVGPLYVFTTALPQPPTMVHAGVNTSFAVVFSDISTVATTDRFLLIDPTYTCGDSDAQVVGYTSELDSTTYAIDSNSLVAGPVNLTQTGLVKICYCSSALEGECPAIGNNNKTSYGITVGTTIISDFTIDGKKQIGIKPASTSVTIACTNCLSLTAVNLSFVPSDQQCSIATANSPLATPLVAFDFTVDTAKTFDFTSITAGRSLLRLCVFQNSNVAADLNLLGVYVNDVVVSPKVASQTVAELTLTSTYSLQATDSIWFIDSSQVSCADGPPAQASNFTTALQSLTSPAIYVDFTAANAGDFSLCVAASCGVGVVCDVYYGFADVVVSVFSELKVSPTTVTQSVSSLVITFAGVLDGSGTDTVWFQNSGSCVLPTVATVNSTEPQVLTTSPMTVSFNFTQMEPSSVPYRMCGQTGSTVTDYSPIGVVVADVRVSPRTVNQGVSSLSLLNSTTLSAGDRVYFLETNQTCSNIAPVTGVNSTGPVVISTLPGTYDFDFSQMAGDSRLCLIPSLSGQAIDLGGDVAGLLETRVKITNLALDTTSVRSGDASIGFTYGEDVLLYSGKVWFERNTTCSSPGSSTATKSSSNFVPASGKTASFSFASASVSFDLYTLCYEPAVGAPVQQFNSVGVLVNDVQVNPRSVFPQTNQVLSLTSVSGAGLTDGWEAQFRHISASCASTASPGLESSKDANTTLTAVGSGDYRCNGLANCHITTLDFTSAAVSSEPYRLCVTNPSGGQVRDLDVVIVYVIDLQVRPKTSGTGSVNVTFTNAATTNIPASESLRGGDYVWFLDASNSNCGVKPLAMGVDVTAAQLVLSGTYMYSFNFPKTNYFRPCVQRGSEVWDYSGIPIFISGISVTITGDSVQNPVVVSLSGSSIQVDLADPDTQLTLAGTTLARFVRSSLSCEETSDSAHSTGSIALSSLTSLTIANFDNITASDTPLRLCVVTSKAIFGGNVNVTLDVSNTLITRSQVTLPKPYVFKSSNQTVDVEIYAGLGIGDQVFFSSSSPCPSIPTTATSTTTMASTVTRINSFIASLEYDFTSVVSSSLNMCVQRVGESRVIDYQQTLTVFDSGVFSFTTPFATTAKFSTFATENVDISRLRIDIAAGKYALVDMGSACTSASFPSSSTSITTGSTTVTTPPTPFSADFRYIRMSADVLRLCAELAGPIYVDYGSTFGAIVTDLKINGVGSAAFTAGTQYELPCVTNAAAQSIDFTVSADAALAPTDVLFFKLRSSSDLTCGPVPLASTTTTSNAVQMSFLDASSASSLAWSLTFDFSAAVPSTSLSSEFQYRLCVQRASGVVIDYFPLSVLVSDLGVAGVSGVNSVRPFAAQPVTFSSASGFGTAMIGITAMFIDASSAAATCECAFTNTCSSVTKSDEQVITTAFPFTTNFSFVGFDSEARLCLKQGTTYYSHSCATLNFDVTVSPKSIPANTQQDVQLSFANGILLEGDKVVFKHASVPCPANFSATMDRSKYSSIAEVTSTGATLTFDFDGFSVFGSGSIAQLCVSHNNSTGYAPSSATILVTEEVVVAIAGDPHVRSATGDWLDFYGESGVYNLLDGEMIQANAKFGYAVRDDFMIWHPKVMRPGTVVEEVGIALKDSQTSLRLGVQGGGIVSVRQNNNLQSTDFWGTAADKTMQLGDYSITWSKCVDACEVVMPWGTHQRSHSLKVQGRGELLQLFVAKSGGYRFIDVEAIAGASAGLLADAASAPDVLAQRLASGGESVYKMTALALQS